MVDRVALDLIAYLDSVTQSLGDILEDGVHLLTGLHPLLLGVEHTFWVIQILTRREADEAVVSLGIILINEVDIVGADQLNTQSLRELLEMLIDDKLQLISLVVGTLDGSLMELKLKIVVIAKEVTIPLDTLLGSSQVALSDEFWNLATQTSRAANKTFVILLQLATLGTWSHIISVGPGTRHQLDEVVVALLVLSQENEVITTLVNLTLTQSHTTTCHIDLTANDSLKILLGQSVILRLELRQLSLLLRGSLATIDNSLQLLNLGLSLLDIATAV